MTKHSDSDPNDPQPIAHKPAAGPLGGGDYSDHHDDIGDFSLTARVLWEKYGANALLLILVGLLAFMAVRWYSGREQRTYDTAYNELAQATDPIGKEEVAGKYESLPHFAAQAYLESGQLRLRESIEGTGDRTVGGQPKAPSEQEKQHMLQEAAGSFQKVIDLPSRTTLQEVNARFGLAAVRENQAEFDKASQQYQAIEKAAGEAYPSLASKAKKLDESLSRISTPVIFAAAPPKPEPKAEAAGPAAPTNLAVPDVKLTPAKPAPAPAPSK